MISRTKQAIQEALDQARVIDPHCHLRLDRPAADNLADLLFYHHLWIELVSSGLPPYEVTREGLPQELADPQMEPLERARRALPYLKHVRSTTIGLFWRWLLRDLYGVEDELNAGNLERVAARVAERAQDPAWPERLLRERCGITASVSVELRGRPCAPRMLRGKEGLLGWLTHYGKRPLAGWLAQAEQAGGSEAGSAADYREMLTRAVRALPLADYQFVNLNAPAAFTHQMASEAEVTRTLGQIKAGEAVDRAAVGGLAYFGMAAVLDALRGAPIRTIQFMAGAELLPPPTVHRSMSQWGSGFAGALGRLAGEFPEFHFDVTTATDIYTQDVAVLAKHVPNISVAGYWWHTLYPHYIRKTIETRLDLVPLNKIIMFFSDAYHAEWCYPKLKMVKQLLGEVLAERVEKGWYSLATAREIIEATFYENPKAIYHIPETA